ncbi:autophagy-related protein 13-domain-containing protein [Durotheca rogersii]|uniref:autophagy-related protein 13-domain-containing protein n=1 Tax=Durotheca rogersii TaxID=419775 RepID=UPI0022210053|nr:autophagy-related protein 13-domain-containing protein [Durotheca rogersii]KAI5856707.1 autophagy-related protein 13-domain-containing protein [Durotheca rogersii]
MHQTPRAPPRTASPALSVQTNPTRTNNQRDLANLAVRPPSRPSSAIQDGAAGVGGGNRGTTNPSRESVKKLDQIIQNVYSKAGTVILQARMQVTPILVGKSQERRTSRWFQLDTDDIDDFRDDFRVWKQCGGLENRPPPLVIETYLDASHLKGGQSLVILDENGKRWDVVEALNSSDQSSDSSSGRHGSRPVTHLVLERWRVELKGSVPENLEDFGLLLPTVYKKAIVLMRSIYTTTGILPAWKLARNSKTKGIHPALATRCQVFSGESPAYGSDTLRIPLFEGRGDVSTDYMFGDLEVPVGRFYVSVSYRNHCSFQVVETESLLSSRIGMAISDDMFRPSLPRRGHGRHESYTPEPGSLPYHRHAHDVTENQQRYGSLSTFHGEGPIGTSPISALKAVKAPGSDTSSPIESRPGSLEAPPHTLPIVSGPARKPSLRGLDTTRRPSISFQSSPFKQGSLSALPVTRAPEQDVPPSPQSLSRPLGTNIAAHARNRSSLTAGMPASLRGGPPTSTTAPDNPVGSSPRPSATGRFSSSFTHRRNRPSLGGISRVDDDQNSSGKQSLASSVAQPGSGLLNEIGAAGSSGSFQTDDDNIKDFLKVIESKRTLQSFESTKKGESATKRTAAQLSKFHLMRESNNALTESMNSSMQLQRSSSSSSRQLGNVPGMSASSSPGGKPLSPHTPHTPAIPSRLSENSSVDYTPTTRLASRARNVEDLAEEPTVIAQTTHEGTTAIDIPTSPRPYPHARRSSSVAHPNRALADDDDAHRSVSLGAEDREAPSLSVLLGLGAAEAEGASAAPALQSPANIRTASPQEMLGPESESVEREVGPPGGLMGFPSSPYRRYGGSAGQGIASPHSASSSLVGSGGRYIRGNSRGGATGLGVAGASAEEADDELLLFDMSEITRDQSRRSTEEGRHGPGVDRGGGVYESNHRSRRW